MSKRDKLARGGAIVRPLLANGKRPEILIFFNLRTQRFYEEAYKELTGRERRFINLFRDFYTGVLECETYDLSMTEIIAIIRAASIGTKNELTIAEIETAFINSGDKTKISTALTYGMPESKQELTNEQWDELNKGETSAEVQTTLGNFIHSLPESEEVSTSD